MASTKPILWFAGLAGALLVISTVLFGLLYVKPHLETLRKVGVAADFQSYRNALGEYHGQHGQYPLLLTEASLKLSNDGLAKNRWGHPLIYLSDGSFYILVSTGRDGRPDGENYILARLQPTRTATVQECRNLDVDQIMSDLGCYRCCGK